MKIQRIVTLLCTAALLLCAASPPALAADRSAACYYPVEQVAIPPVFPQRILRNTAEPST